MSAPDGAQQALVERMPLDVLLRDWQVGSGPWDWATERTKLQTDPVRKLHIRRLTEQVKTEGIREPVLLGNDGRVWDGHHRITIAMTLGLPDVPVERVV